MYQDEKLSLMFDFQLMMSICDVSDELSCHCEILSLLISCGQMTSEWPVLSSAGVTR